MAAWRGLLWFTLLCLCLVAGVLLARHAPDQTAARATPLPAPLPGLPSPALGVHLDPTAEPAAFRLELEQFHAAGITWVRVPINWATIEPQPGAYNWQHTDEILAALAQSSLVPVFVLTGSPAWTYTDSAPSASTVVAKDADTSPPVAAHTPPARFEDFATFARAFARRAAHALPHLPRRGYQIWHEPNLASNWGNRHVSAVAYAQLVRATAPALRAGDPQAYILSGALSPTNDQGHLAQNEPYFLRRFLAAGGGRLVDAIAIEPYGFAAVPLAPAPAPRALTFDRVRMIRHTLVQAGYGHLPLWATSFGWNRDPNTTWQTVDRQHQMAYTTEAVQLAQDWPWLHALGWPHTQHGGFALTPDLLQAFTTSPTPSPATGTQAGMRVSSVGISPLWGWWGLGLVVALAIQRGVVASRLVLAALPRYQLTSRTLALAWLVFIPIYYMATWPPLILFCWLIAGMLVWLRPRWGLYLAATLLPFYFYHKELQLAELRITLAPSLLLTLALGLRLLGVFWRRLRLRSGMDWFPPQLSAGMGLAAGWVVLALTGSLIQGLLQFQPAQSGSGVPLRHISAYIWAFLHLSLTPLILWLATKHFAGTFHRRRHLLVALCLGGVGASALGLFQWLGGTGVFADGTLRLTGPYYSPNHMALYGIRTLMLLAGLMLVPLRHTTRFLWLAAAGLCLITLLLTASRGALLLGLPAGLLVLGWGLPWRAWQRDRLRRRLPGIRPRLLLTGLGTLLLAGGALIWLAVDLPRLGNMASVLERWAIWQAAWQMWRDTPWTGVGPGGFYWTLPAHIPAHSPIDPSLRHPHNLVLELLTQGGILGLVWWLALWVWTYKKIRPLYPLRRQSLPALGVLAGLAAGAGHGLVDAFIALPDLAGWNTLALALLVYWHPFRKSREQSIPPHTLQSG